MKNMITKAMVLKALAGYFSAEQYDADEVLATNGEVNVTAGDVVAYCAKTLEQMEAKAVKAKTYNTKRKAEGDAFRERVLGFVTAEFQTRDQIFANFADEEDITIAKVGARLSQLVKEGKVVKEEAKDVLGKTKVHYKLA